MRLSNCVPPGSRLARSGAHRRAVQPDDPASQALPRPAFLLARSRQPAWSLDPSARSVAAVPLLAPWVAVHVIAVGLPEAGLVLRHKLQSAHPLRALPEIEMRHQEPRWAAMYGLEWRTIEVEGHPGLTARNVLERQVCGVAAVRKGHHVLSGRVETVQQGIDR